MSLLTAAEIRPSALLTMPYGARFELGPGRHAQAVERALALYDFIFTACASVLAVAYVWREEEAVDVLRLFGTAAVEADGDPDPFDDPASPSPARKIVATVSGADFRVAELFALIAAADLGMTPFLDAKVYLADAEAGVVLHAYDDRGAYVGATEPEPIEALRSRFGAWVVG